MSGDGTNQELHNRDRPQGRISPTFALSVRSHGLYRNLANGLEDPVNFWLRNCGGASIELLIKDKVDAAVIGIQFVGNFGRVGLWVFELKSFETRRLNREDSRGSLGHRGRFDDEKHLSSYSLPSGNERRYF